MQYPRSGSGDVTALTVTTGAKVPPDENGEVTMAATTYFFALDEPGATLSAVHVRVASAVAAVFTIETCNFPKWKGGHGNANDGVLDVSDFDDTAGNWIKEDPTTAEVGTVGAGWSVSNMTVTHAAGAAGGFTLHLGNLGTKRCRMRVVASVGGKARVNFHGKA